MPKIKIQTTPKPHCLYTSPMSHANHPTSPSILETGGLGLLPRLAEASLGWLVAGAGWMGSVGPPPPPDGARSPSAPGAWALGCCAGWQRCGWAWAAPGWIRGRLATDSCLWRLLRCLPSPPLAVTVVGKGRVLGGCP